MINILKYLRSKNLLFVLIYLLLSYFLTADSLRIPPETVLAEYTEGVITMTDLTEEFYKLPEMFRSRYNTIKGREELLQAILINRLSYLEALRLNIDSQSETYQAYEDELKPYYAAVFRQKNITEQVEISEEEIIDYYRSTSQTEPIESIKVDIKNHLIQFKDRELKDNHIEALKDRYNVEVNHSLLSELNLLTLNDNNDILKEKVVTSSISEISITVGDLFEHFKTVSPFITQTDLTNSFDYYSHIGYLSREEWAELASSGAVERLVNNLIDVGLFDYEARRQYDEEIIEEPELAHSLSKPRESKYDVYVFEHPEVKQLRRHIILKQFYRRLVKEVADPSPEEIKAYYQDNISRYSTREHRKIRLFLYDTEEKAVKVRKEVIQAKRENNEERILDIVRNSLYPYRAGKIPFIYNDPILPVFGEDEKMYRVIWETEIGSLSDIYTNKNNQFFFLEVMNYYASETYSFDNVESYITRIMTSDRRLERWQEVQRELFQKYNAVIYPERLRVVLSAEELFRLAERSRERRNFIEAIDYYDRIIKHHHNNNDDYNALFMKAILLSEELGNKQEAIEIYQRIINTYPKGSLHKSAEYMLDSLLED